MLHALYIAAALLAAPQPSVSPYFCDTEGTVLKYERSYAGSGRLKWRHEMTIREVERMDDGSLEIDYQSEFRRPGGGRMYGGPVALSAVVEADGDVLVDVSASLVSVFRNLLPDRAVSAEPCLTLLPSGMEPGDVLPDAACTVGAAFADYDVTVSSRSVLRRESINTPAGEFDCIVVSEHKVERGPGRNRETTALTWYARGIGMVRHDTYDKNMKLETSEVLTEIESGL